MAQNPEKIKAYRIKYLQVNRERLRTQYRAYYEANKEQHNKATREYYLTHKEQLKAASRLYVMANAEKTADYQRQYREDHAEQLKAYEAARSETKRAYALARYYANHEEGKKKGRDWKSKNHDQVRAHAHTRRAIELHAEGTHTASEIAELRAKQANRCVYFSVCGNMLCARAHRDHIEPLVPSVRSGRPPGRNSIDNIQLLCPACNQKKHNKDPYTFTQEHAGRLFPDLPVKRKHKA